MKEEENHSANQQIKIVLYLNESGMGELSSILPGILCFLFEDSLFSFEKSWQNLLGN